MPEELKVVMDPPYDFVYLWNWLCEHVYPLSFAELSAWQALTGRRLSGWEIRAFMELDKVRSNG